MAHPLQDLALLRKPAFVGVMLGALAFNGAAFGVIPHLSIRMQTLLDMSPVRGGLTLLPMTGASVVVAILAGKPLHGVPARLTIGGGLLLIGSGGFCQAVLDAGTHWTVLVPGLVLVGIGVGLVSPALAGAALAAVPPERAGMAGGAVNTVRQLGYALGVAVFGTVLTSRTQDTVSHDAAHTPASGGAGALRAAVSEHTACGLDTASVAAGVTGMIGGALVLALVRTPRAAATAAGTPADTVTAPRA
ncbi:MFS transporter [Streptomyces sp. NPDC005141]